MTIEPRSTHAVIRHVKLDGLELPEIQDENGQIIVSAVELDGLCERAAILACRLSDMEPHLENEYSHWTPSAVVYYSLITARWDENLASVVLDATSGTSESQTGAPAGNEAGISTASRRSSQMKHISSAFTASLVALSRKDHRLFDEQTWNDLIERIPSRIPNALDVVAAGYNARKREAMWEESSGLIEPYDEWELAQAFGRAE